MPRPRKTGGRPPRESPRPPVGSGRKRERGRKPGANPRVGGSSSPGARPRASHARTWPLRRGAAPAGAAALSLSRSYAPPTKEPGTRVTADSAQGSPHVAAAVTPRTATSESAPSGKSGPVPDDDTDRAPTGMGAAAAIAVAATVAATSRGAGRIGPSPAGLVARMKIRQKARCQRSEKSLQDSGKAQGWNQTHGDQASTGKRSWQDPSWPRDRPHGGGKGKNQGRGSGRRGKGSKPDTPSPRRRSSGNSRSAGKTARPRGSPRRSRTSTDAEEAAGAATSRAQPTKEPAGRAQERRSCPCRPRPAGLPEGSNE